MDIEALDLPPYTHAAVLTGRDIVTGLDLHYVIVWADRSTGTCDQCNQPISMQVDECPVILNLGAGAGGAIEEPSKQHGCGNWLTVDWTEVKPVARTYRYRGLDKDGVGRTGATEADPSAFAQEKYNAGWRKLTITQDGEPIGPTLEVGGSRPDLDTGNRTWWGETAYDQVAPDVTVDAVLAAARQLADRRATEIGAQAESIEKDLRDDLRKTLAALAEPLADGETMDERIEELSSGSETAPGVYCDDDGRWQAWEHDPASEFGATITVYADDLAQVTR